MGGRAGRERTKGGESQRCGHRARLALALGGFDTGEEAPTPLRRACAPPRGGIERERKGAAHRQRGGAPAGMSI